MTSPRKYEPKGGTQEPPAFLWLIPAALILLPVSIHLFNPQSALNHWLSTRAFVAQIFAFPLPAGLLLGILALILLSVEAVRRKKNYGLLSAVSVLLLTSLLLLLAGSSLALPAAAPGEASQDSPKQARIVEWNALSELSAEDIRLIFREKKADIGIFPEYNCHAPDGLTREDLLDHFRAAGLKPDDYQFFHSNPCRRELEVVTVIIRKDFGLYEPEKTEETSLGTLKLLPADKPELPPIIALHCSPPLPGLMDSWQDDLERIAAYSRHNKNALIAGDFNANLRHGALGRIEDHADVLSVLPQTERGSWPAGSPRFLRASIDHILVPCEKTEVIRAEILPSGHSDHLPVYAEISLGSAA